jgi:hypothetical protein
MSSRILLCIGVLSLLLSTPATAQEKTIDPEKAQNIQRLLKLIGAEKLQKSMAEQVIALLKPAMLKAGGSDEKAEKVLNRFTDILFEEFQKLNFSNITAEIYDKYFTNDDIKSLIAFYESPIGQKAISVLPSVTQESVKRGAELGEAAVPKALSRLAAEFPELKDFLK